MGWALGLLALPGCTGAFQQHRAEIRHEFAHGHYQQIADTLDHPDVRARYREGDRLLWLLDRGAAALALNDTRTVLATLNEAETLMDLRRRQNAGDVLASLLVNDTLTTYRGEAYEDLYVNVLKLLAHLEAGRVRGYATVEARRLAHKVNQLRAEYLILERTLRDHSTAPALQTGVAPPRSVARTRGGEFIESALGTFLTAVTFLHAGDRSNQRVAARRLREAIGAQGHLIGPVKVEPFAGLGELGPDEANVLLVAFSGRGPEKVPEFFGPIFVHHTPIYFELPIVRSSPNEVSRVRVLFESGFIGAAGARAPELHLIEDLGSVAAENHRRQLPNIYLRTLLRAAGKSYALTELNRAAYHSEHDEGVAALAALGGLALLTATEKADLRGWSLLPGQAHVGLLALDPGHHRLWLEYLRADGSVAYRSPPRDVHVEPDGLTTIVEEYWR